MALALLFFVASLLLSMFGMGGGLIYTPVQILAGVAFYKATTVSLFAVILTSSSAAFTYIFYRKVNFRLAGVMALAGLTGAFFGGLIAFHVPETLLRALLIAAILGGSALIWFQPRTLLGEKVNGPSRFYIIEGENYRVNAFLAAPLFLLAGAFASSIGIGGGVFAVPILNGIFGVPLKIAIGTTTVTVFFTSLSGFISHAIHVKLQLKQLALLALAVVAGSQLGSRISVAAPPEKLRKAFSAFLLCLALWLIIKWSLL